jgi:hypothetical protein
MVALTNSQRAPEPLETPEQYHIQTDQGSERFFKFQTLSGQYRREQRHHDGSVTGTYGWVDPNGILRLTDYIADDGGYRIEQNRLYQVNKHKIIDRNFFKNNHAFLINPTLTGW